MSEIAPSVPNQVKQAKDRTRNWVFTCNNYTAEDQLKISKLFDENQIRYYCYGKEVGEEGTPHLQGYFQLFNPKGLSILKKLLGNQFHLEQAKGTPDECIAYCKKDGEFTENGDCKKQGQRTDIKELCENNSSYQQIITNTDNLDKLAKGINVVKDFYKYKELQNVKFNYEKHIIWLAGPTGCGKTKWVIDWCQDREYPATDLWISNNDLKWFDGYTGQKVALFDDFRKESCSFNFLLRLIDRYYLQVPVKGGFVTWQPEYIFITCPRIPQFEFVAHGSDGLTRVYEDVQQINRRCESIFEWNKESKEFSIIQ